jgi:hypothetical protein
MKFAGLASIQSMTRRLRFGFLCVLATTVPLAGQAVDLCDCARSPGLRRFDAGDPRTYPPGTTGCAAACQSGSIVLSVPADGVLRFASFTASGAFTIGFRPNATNTPVTMLVAGDVVLRAPACCGTVVVSGHEGGPGSAKEVGAPGLGGPGAYKGGRGHGPPLGLGGLTPGGNGEGPGGGWGSTTNFEAIGGTFTGPPELQPLVGGSGGGGGSGNGFEGACNGGGGGGGGGALLIRANGRITIENFHLSADGGTGGEPGDRNCAQGGAGGSGGAIRLVARAFTVAGTARVTAAAGKPAYRAGTATAGRVRLESLDGTVPSAIETEPIAARAIVNSPPQTSGAK